MSSHLRERLASARHFRFVGRTAERAFLQSVLSAAELPLHVVYVFGPGGVGKTTLLHELVFLCEHSQIPALYVDTRNVEPSPEAFVAALQRNLNHAPQDSIFGALAAHEGHYVLLIDTYETLTPLDDWMRTAFLPQLPSNTLVVLAGRQPPSLAWRTDPGWQQLLHTIPLRNLSPGESRDYLALRDIPPDQHQVVFDFTHGHPLALSLVADVFAQRPGFHFHPEETPDVVRALLAQFLQKVPGPAHRAALEVCALVRLTTESLLAEVLQLPDAHDLFMWLHELSFIEARQRGVFPHDLAREALTTDLRWRNPDWYTELHRRARAYHTARLGQSSGSAQQQTLFDLVYLHRDNPVVRPYFEWELSGSVVTDQMRSGDIQTLQAMVARHEGDESARIASYWLSRRPETALVWRDNHRQPVGWLMALPLHEVAQDPVVEDPAIHSIWPYLQNHAPLRPHEVATLFRFWMAADTYQAVSMVQSAIFINVVRHYLTTPRLAYTFFPCADPDFWADVFAYADLQRITSADFEVGGRRYGVYGHDWRRVPPVAWLELLAEREIATTPLDYPTQPVERLLVLSESDFADSARDALRHLTQPDMLASNPLLQSRLVLERVGHDVRGEARTRALQALIQEVADALQESPRQIKLYRALYHTYFNPAPTQERAAEILDLPFSTFRRHLKAGVDYLVQTLWQKEISQ